LCLISVPPEWGIVAFYVKDNSFDVINIQISFNYLWLFKNYLEVPELSEHLVYNWSIQWHTRKIFQHFKDVLWRSDSKSTLLKLKWCEWIQMYTTSIFVVEHARGSQRFCLPRLFNFQRWRPRYGYSQTKKLGINKIRQAFFRLIKIWRNTRMSNTHTNTIYSTCIKLALLYVAKLEK